VKAKTGEFILQNYLFLTFGLFMMLLFFLGGSSRSDSQSLLLLRPATALMFGYTIWIVRKSHLQNGLLPLIIIGTTLSVALLYLVPVAGDWWKNLGGWEITAMVDSAVFGASQSRALAVNPIAARNYAFALLVAATAILFLIQLHREQQFLLLPFCLCLGFATALLGLLQIIGDPRGPLYLYRLTNPGSSVGVFANRNHQAIFLAILFPMLAAYATVNVRTPLQTKVRGWIAFAGGTILVPLLLVTGSRAGLISGILGIMAAFWIYQKPAGSGEGNKSNNVKLDWRVPAVVVAIAALAATTLVLSRAEAIQRLFDDDVGRSSRTDFWGEIVTIVNRQLPFGNGPGGFADAYRTQEPTGLLQSNYLNHAHNDWLELVTDFGVFGIAIAFFGIVTFYVYLTRTKNDRSERTRIFGKVGIAGLAILTVGSIGDYPARTPLLSAMAVILLMWSIGSSDIKDKRWIPRK
jgi:hypothetical protein